MNVLVVSDIHGNWPALRAVLDDADGEYGALASCGDMVGAIPFNARVLREIDNRATYAVRGNHDSRLLPQYIYDPTHEAARLEAELVDENLNGMHRNIVRDMPERVDTPHLVMAHSRPFIYRDDGYPHNGFAEGDTGTVKGEFTRIGPHLDGRCCFVGHTHDQAMLDCNRFAGQSGLVVNPGSVGQPWDGEAEYAIVNIAHNECELYSVEYNHDEVYEAFEEVGFDPDLSRKPAGRHRRGSMR